MKTNYDLQLTNLINKALGDIYKIAKGKPDINFFTDDEISLFGEDLRDEFLNKTIELIVTGDYSQNSTVYVYGLSNDQSTGTVFVLVIDEMGEKETYDIQSLGSENIAVLTDFVNSQPTREELEAQLHFYSGQPAYKYKKEIKRIKSLLYAGKPAQETVI